MIKKNKHKTDAAIGIDIGGTNTVFGLVSRDGGCIYKSRISTLSFSSAKSFVDALAVKIGQLIKKYSPAYTIKGIGVGAPNGNYFKGTIEQAPNLRWKGVIPFAAMLGSKTGLNVVLTNDANAAALGEMMFGSAKEMKNFIVITLGTGLGSGIVVDGKVVYGHDGFAGEIGHVIVDEHGRTCGCGRLGCLETYVSAQGIVNTAKQLLKNTKKPSVLRDKKLQSADSKKIYLAAKAGDKVASETFDITARILGLALANSVAYTSPQAIFFFGGVANAGSVLFNPTKKYFEKNLLPVFRGKIKILPSGLDKDEAAILGAASLICSKSS